MDRKYWGASDVRLLNGGWKAWTLANLPTQSETPAMAASTFVAKLHAARLADKQELLDSLKQHDLQIVDARSEAEFCGEDAANNKRAGAIPGVSIWNGSICSTNRRSDSSRPRKSKNCLPVPVSI